MKNNRLILVLSLILFFIPIVFWGNLYNVGGDDSKLYYLYPLEYLIRFGTTILPHGMLGASSYYFMPGHVIGFSLFILLLKKIFFFLNTQNVAFGLNLSFGFLFFYQLLGLWIKDSRIKIISSLFYIFSTANIYTIWSHQLPALYLISIFPLIYYLFIRAIQENKMRLVIIAALILSVFSILILMTPWTLGLLLAGAPYLIYLSRKYFKRTAVFSGVFFILIILLNLYWLFHFVYSPFSSRNPQNNIISLTGSDNFKLKAAYEIAGTTQNFKLKDALFNSHQSFITKNYTQSLSPIFQHLLNTNILNAIFIFIIVFSLLCFDRIDLLKKSYLIFVSSYLLFIFLYSPKIGNWGVPLFLVLNKYILGFSMFRNMFDKFAPTVSFLQSIVLALSLYQVSRTNVFKKFFSGILLLLLIAIFVNSYIFLSGEIYRKPVDNSKVSAQITGLNADFLNIASYLNRTNLEGDVLWWPLNSAGYGVVEDSNLHDHFYLGVSPLPLFTNRQDYTGTFSFDPSEWKVIIESLKNKNTTNLGHILNNHNIAYIISINDFPTSIAGTYVLDKDLYKLHDNMTLQTLVEKEGKNFGTRYTLYKVKPIFKSPLISSSNKESELTYKKVSDYEYHINLKAGVKDANLTFKEPYHDQWKLISDSDSTHKIIRSQTNIYSNQWTIEGDASNSAKYNTYRLIFSPKKYIVPMVIISASTYILCFVYLIYCYLKVPSKKI